VQFTILLATIVVALALVWVIVRSRVLLLLVFMLLAGVFGFARYAQVDQSERLLLYEPLFDETQKFYAVVRSEPDIRGANARYNVVVWPAHLSRSTAQTLGVLLYAPAYSVYEYGEVLTLSGTLSSVENFVDDFDWRAYLAKDEIYAQMFTPQIKRTNTYEGGLVRRQLFAVKNALLASTARILPEPHAALAGGLVFGGKRSMPQGLLDDFRIAGLIHIVVLSGYNITIVAVALMAILGRLSLKLRVGIGAIGMIAFGLMVGGGPTVVRSVLMALLALWARASGRLYAVQRALMLVLFIMVLWSPKVLFFDTGFQLSFIATAGLIWGVPIVAPYLWRIPAVFGLREIVATTIAAQIAVLPLLVYAIGEVSLAALPVNVLVLPTVPFAMALGVCTAFFGLILRPIALLFGGLTYIVLAYMLAIVSLAAAIPYAAIAVPQVPLVAIFATYGAMMYGVYRFYSRSNKTYTGAYELV